MVATLYPTVMMKMTAHPSSPPYPLSTKTSLSRKLLTTSLFTSPTVREIPAIPVWPSALTDYGPTGVLTKPIHTLTLTLYPTAQPREVDQHVPRIQQLTPLTREVNPSCPQIANPVPHALVYLPAPSAIPWKPATTSS